MIARFLDEGDTVHFACQQAGDCCRHFAIYCTPYDLVRLRCATGRSTTEMLAAGEYEIIEESFNAVFTDDAVGALLGLFGAAPRDLFPIARLRKTTDGTDSRCVYLREDHRCGVYAHRPGVCRSYPLGRVRTPEGPRWFLREYGCPGKDQGTVTVAEWVAESGLGPYAAGNDRFAAFARDTFTAGVTYADLPQAERADLRTLLYDFDQLVETHGQDSDGTVAVIETAARAWLSRVSSPSQCPS